MEALRHHNIVKTGPGALFAGSITGSPSCFVIASAAALADVGAVALVALVIPGSLHGRVVVMPNAH